MTRENILNLLNPTPTKQNLLVILSSLGESKYKEAMIKKVKAGNYIITDIKKTINSHFDSIYSKSSNIDSETEETSEIVEVAAPKITGITQSTKFFPISFKKGDVLMHPIFLHPYILLEQKNGYWICCLLTTDKNFKEVLEPCKSRILHNSFFTKQLFTVTEPIGKFMSPFENHPQIKSVLTKLRKIFI